MTYLKSRSRLWKATLWRCAHCSKAGIHGKNILTLSIQAFAYLYLQDREATEALRICAEMAVMYSPREGQMDAPVGGVDDAR